MKTKFFVFSMFFGIVFLLSGCGVGTSVRVKIEAPDYPVPLPGQPQVTQTQQRVWGVNGGSITATILSADPNPEDGLIRYNDTVYILGIADREILMLPQGAVVDLDCGFFIENPKQDREDWKYGFSGCVMKSGYTPPTPEE